MKKSNSLTLLILSYVAFISLGMPDGLHGVAWPSVRQTFGLPLDAIGLLMVFGTAGYSLSGFVNGALVRRLGVGGLLALSCALTSTALLIYSVTPLWPLFVTAALLGGLGAGAIDAGINTYVEHHYSERMMQWLHGSFGIGITMGPLIMTGALGITGAWRYGYALVCLFQAGLAIVFYFTRPLWLDGGTGEDESRGEEGPQASLGRTLRNPRALMSMAMFFIYTGAEVGLGLWAYSLLTESRAVDSTLAGFITGSYWAMFTLGRFTAGWYSKRFSNRQILFFSLLASGGGAVILLVFTGLWGSVGGIGLIGLSIAPIFPCLMSDTSGRVGPEHTANTIGMQISAAGLGAAVVPALAGILARHMGLEVLPPYLLVCFGLLFLIFMGFGRAK